MEFLGADANLCAKSKLGAVGEGGGDVDIHACGIDPGGEHVGGLLVAGDDALAVAASVTCDVRYGLFYTGYGADTHLIVQPFTAKVIFSGVLQQLCGILSNKCGKGLFVGIY